MTRCATLPQGARRVTAAGPGFEVWPRVLFERRRPSPLWRRGSKRAPASLLLGAGSSTSAVAYTLCGRGARERLRRHAPGLLPSSGGSLYELLNLERARSLARAPGSLECAPIPTWRALGARCQGAVTFRGHGTQYLRGAAETQGEKTARRCQ